MATLNVIQPSSAPALPGGDFKFDLHPLVAEPAGYRVAFVILLDGDLVMSPEHLGVALMTSVLRRGGFTVRILEIETHKHEQALQQLKAYDPKLVCFTLMSLNVETCKSFCALLRHEMPDVVLACGGPAGTYAGGEVLAHIPEIDIVAVGEGEPTIWELVQKLYLGESLESCAGIIYRKEDGTVCKAPLRPLMHNLDALPFPARDQFEQHGNDLEYIRLSTSRGCVARCTFCSAPNVSNMLQKGKAWRGRSVESVLEELKELVGRYNYRTYDFIDSTFEDPDGGKLGKARIRQIAQGILDAKLNIYYNCCMRAENWSDGDNELLDLLFRSGLEKVNVGIESGTAEELDLWDKRATVEDNVRIIRLLREHGIYLAMGFIQFHPYSTVDTLRANALFLKNNNGHNLRRLTERLEIYPGTVIVSRLEKDGLLEDGYKSTLHHFAYRFKDERVSLLAKHFASLYNNENFHENGVITEQSSVYKFETFNVVLETYLSRTKRAFGDIPAVQEELQAFRSRVLEIRRELSDFNYNFFMSNLEAVLQDRLSSEDRVKHIREIEAIFPARMNEIRVMQLRMGKKLNRWGIDLSQIASSIQVPDTLGAQRTYTGSSPCW
ncbi:MAG TPA: radical SAM protein [Candidatus Angelobacter sp.]|nr:radical SAM protein [Candidatus Angelobacter sp.]